MRKEYFSLPSICLLAALTATGLTACSRSNSMSSVPPADLAGSSALLYDGSSTGSLYVLSQAEAGHGTLAVFSGSPLGYVREVQQGLDVPTSMVVNSKRQLFVSNFQSENVPIYPAAGSKPIRTLSKSLKEPLQVVVTSKNDVYVRGKRVITVFINSRNNQTKTIKQFGSRLTVDSANNVYSIGLQNTIYVYPPGAIKPSYEITQGLNDPENLIADSSGNLYVANEPSSGCGNVTVYNVGSGALEYTITGGICVPGAMALDQAGNLYVGNASQPSVTEYAAGTNSLVETISKGIVGPGYLAIDASGTLYVANIGASFTGNIVIYPEGQTVPSQTLTENIGRPVGLLWLPKQ
jgi:hypothetical protein